MALVTTPPPSTRASSIPSENPPVSWGLLGIPHLPLSMGCVLLVNRHLIASTDDKKRSCQRMNESGSITIPLNSHEPRVSSNTFECTGLSACINDCTIIRPQCNVHGLYVHARCSFGMIQYLSQNMSMEVPCSTWYPPRIARRSTRVHRD